jgi:hypothetical protein
MPNSSEDYNINVVAATEDLASPGVAGESTTAHLTIKLEFDGEEADDIAKFTSTNQHALVAFARHALSNHLFIREADQQGNEFLLRKADGRLHRVKFF